MDGIKIGLIGLAENWLPSLRSVSEGTLKYLDMIKTGKELALELKSKGILVKFHFYYFQMMNN